MSGVVPGSRVCVNVEIGRAGRTSQPLVDLHVALTDRPDRPTSHRLTPKNRHVRLSSPDSLRQRTLFDGTERRTGNDAWGSSGPSPGTARPSPPRSASRCSPAFPVTFALLHDGFPVSDVDLEAEDVWVTNGDALLAGRLNRQIEELNGAVSGQSPQLDVVQNGSDVFLVDPQVGLGRPGRPLVHDPRRARAGAARARRSRSAGRRSASCRRRASCGRSTCRTRLVFDSDVDSGRRTRAATP